MEGRSEQALKVLRQILRQTELHARDLSRAAGLTPSQRMVLQVLEEEGECTAGTIAKRMGITQATTTTLVDRLQRNHLVNRRRGESDRRQIWIELTQEGRQRLKLAPDGLQEKFARRFDALDRWEQSMLISALERISSILDADELDTAPVLDAGKIDADPPPSL